MYICNSFVEIYSNINSENKCNNYRCDDAERYEFVNVRANG